MPCSVIAVADQRLVALDDVGDAAERRLAGRVRDRHRREVLRRAEREHRADVDPLVGPVEEAAGAGRGALEVGERRDELRVAGRVDDLLERDVRGGELGRVDLDLDLAVLLAEDRDIRDARNAGQARLDDPPREIGELEPDSSFVEFSPISSARLVEDSGWISSGGLLTAGSENEFVSRSSTSWRACSVVVPGSKYRSTVDRPGVDCERTSQTPITPSSRLFSIGTVMYCSTSWLERPGDSVWTSSTGPWESSGSTSVCMFGSVMIPSAISPAARPTSSIRKRSATASSRVRPSIGLPPTCEAPSLP